MSQGVRAAPKRKSGQGHGVGPGSHSPPSQHRVPARNVLVSPIGSPPLGGATTPLVAQIADRSLKEQPHAVRSAGSLMGNVPDRRPLAAVASTKSDGKAPPTPRGKTPRLPKKTPRLSPRPSWVNGPGPSNRKVLEEEEKRRRLRPEVNEDPNMRRSASGSQMEGLQLEARPSATQVTGYPVVQPPEAAHPRYPGASVSGSTTPTDGGEGVPFTLLSRLRNNPMLQVQDSRIMRLIGKRSVLKSNGEIQSVRAKPSLGGSRQNPAELQATSENCFEPEENKARPAVAVAVAVEAAEAAEAASGPPRDELPREGEHEKDANAHCKVPQQDSPRNHVLPEAELAADAGPIVWPGAEAEESEPVPEPAVPVERQRRKADVSHVEAAAEVPVPARAGSAASATPEMPLLQNEAGSLVVPQTWRFVPPPPEQAPKPCYDKVLEAKAALTAVTATATPPREDATPSAREELTPKKLIEDLVQDQVKLDLRDKQLLVEQLVECLIDQVKRYEKELGAEQRANRALKMSLEVEQRKALMYHQRLSELAQQLPFEAADRTLEPEL